MMSRRRVVAAITGVAMAGTACVASSGAPSSSWFDPDQAVASAPAGEAESSPATTRGGGYAREEGPRVSVYAEVENSAGTRLVRANFHLEDDAYVLVGHIDADGVLRIEFPEAPLDNGFARGHASYQTAQFFAGFVDQYRARFSSGLYRLGGASANDSYDGGLGFVFVIASWQPMHFEKLSTGGRWDSFEVNDADYAKDPRPAIYELASLLAGTNASAYTVRFARAFDTRTMYGASGLAFTDAYGSQLCSGSGYGFSFGFASTPFGFVPFRPISFYGYGQSFWWRGSQYLYSAANDCYYQSGFLPFGFRPGYPYGYPYGWSVAQTPPPPQARPGGRMIGIDQIRKPPLTPQPGPMHIAPGSATDVGATQTTQMRLAPDNTSPQYRTRGLVAHQDPVGGEVLGPRSIGVERRARDAGSGFQGLVIRGGNSVGNGNNDGRSQVGRDEAMGRRSPSSRGGDAPTASSPRFDTPRNDAPRAAPQPRAETPRFESPRMAPAPAPRAEAPHVAPAPPSPRVEAPRSEPARSEPAARSAPPASSSSTGKPPGSKN